MAKENFSREESRHPESGCILKIKTNGRSFRGLVDYQSERGANIDGAITQLPIFTNMLGRTPRELSREMAVIRRLRPGLNAAVGHLQICPSRALKTKEEWIEAVQTAFDAHGINDAPFVCYLHSEGDGKTNHAHLHIAFSRIRFDGSVISDSGSYRKNEIAARMIEEKFQLGVIQERSREKRPHDSRKAFDSLRREDRLVGESKEKPSGGMSGKKSSKSKGPKRMATKENIEKMAAAVERAMQHATSESEFKEGLENDLEEQGIARQVTFARRGAENEIFGFSLVSDLGSSGIAAIKGSELGRHLSWTKVAAQIAENQDRARRRRMALHQTEATANAIQDAAQVLAAPTEGTGAVIALGLGAQPRAVVKATTRPTPGAKPQFFVVKAQGLEIPGYLATRGECLDPEHDVHLWEYRRSGSDEIAFSDDGESLQIHGESLADPLAVDAFVLAARARFGTSLTLVQVPEGAPRFLAMLQASAAERGVEIVDGRTGLPIGAQQAHKEPTPATEGMQGLGFLDFKQDLAPASAPVVAGPGQGEAPAAPAQPQPLAPDRSDLAARRRAAAEVAALVQREVTTPGPALGTMPRDASKVSSVVLRAQLERAQAFLPAQAWAEQVAAWHRAEHEAFGDRALSPKESVLREAEISRDPLAAAARKAAQDRSHAEACLFLARQERDARSAGLRGMELLSGKARERDAEISRLEAVEKDAKAAELRTRREFFDQQGVQKKVAETDELRETHHAERSALEGVAGLLRILAGLVRKLAGMVTEAVRRETEQERDRARDAELREHLERLAAGEPEAVERQRRELEELEKQQQDQRESIVIDRERGRG